MNVSDTANARIQRLADAYASMKREAEAAEERAKSLKAEAAAIEAQLFDALEDANLRSVKIDGLGSFRLNDLAWAKIEDRAAALEWADQNRPELLTLNHMQLSMVVREAIKEDGEIPPGVTFTTSRKIGWRKA